MMKEQVLAQALLLSGELDEQQAALLEVLCGAAVGSLSAQLKEGICPEDCEAEFTTAASLLALAAWRTADAGGSVEEFKAGDLTVKKGSHGDQTARCLRQQALELLNPWMKDRFCFTGV